MNKRRTSLFFFILSMLFFYIPLVILIVYSFNDGKSMVWKGFSLKWYRELFMYSDNIWKAFRYSVGIAIVSGLTSTIIGTLGAIGLQWYDFKGKKYLQTLTYVPLVIPEIILGVSLLILFATIKFELGLTTIFIAHTTFNIPFVLFIILSRLEEFDYSIVEAAYDLGATEWQALTKVIIPAILPGIISGFLIVSSLLSPPKVFFTRLYYNFLYFPRDYFIKYFCRLLVDRVKIIDIPISKTDSALITGETPNLIIE